MGPPVSCSARHGQETEVVVGSIREERLRSYPTIRRCRGVITSNRFSLTTRDLCDIERNKGVVIHPSKDVND